MNNNDQKLYGDYLFPLYKARLGCAPGILVFAFLLVMFLNGVSKVVWSDVTIFGLLSIGLLFSFGIFITSWPQIHVKSTGFRIGTWLGWSEWIDWHRITYTQDPWMSSKGDFLVVGIEGINPLFLCNGLLYSRRFNRAILIHYLINDYQELRRRFIVATNNTQEVN